MAAQESTFKNYFYHEPLGVNVQIIRGLEKDSRGFTVNRQKARTERNGG